MELITVGARAAGLMRNLGGRIAGLIKLTMTAFALGFRWYSNRKRDARMRAKVKEIRRLMAKESDEWK